MWIVRNVRAARLFKDIVERSRSYETVSDESRIKELQLDCFNDNWRKTISEIPYYKRLVQQGRVPSRFQSWEEFIDTVPISNRATLKKETLSMQNPKKPADFFRITGGTTAEPVRLPAWHSETRFSRADMWYARSWFGISPSSKLFLLWGHSHLLGTGLKGRINASIRVIKDYLAGYYRFSAYHLDSVKLVVAAQRLIEFRPDYLIGYSVALDCLARLSVNASVALRECRLKAVIGAAECFPFADSEELLENVFGTFVSMEYGSVETALIAHRRPNGRYFVFWRSYFVEAERHDLFAQAWNVRVTSLYPRCFPLVRYEIGDQVSLVSASQGSLVAGVLKFEKVMGRCNDYVELPDGSRLHSELFTHAMRECQNVESYQVVQRAGRLQLTYRAPGDLSPSEIEAIRNRLVRIHTGLGNVEVIRVLSHRQTLAGKTPMVIVQ